MGYGPTTSAIQDGNIVGMNIPAGAPVSSTTIYALMGERMTIPNWSQSLLMHQCASRGGGGSMTPGTYPNQTEQSGLWLS